MSVRPSRKPHFSEHATFETFSSNQRARNILLRHLPISSLSPPNPQLPTPLKKTPLTPKSVLFVFLSLSICLSVVASCPLKDIAHLFTFLLFYPFTFKHLLLTPSLPSLLKKVSFFCLSLYLTSYCIVFFPILQLITKSIYNFVYKISILT